MNVSIHSVQDKLRNVAKSGGHRAFHTVVWGSGPRVANVVLTCRVDNDLAKMLRRAEAVRISIIPIKLPLFYL